MTNDRTKCLKKENYLQIWVVMIGALIDQIKNFLDSLNIGQKRGEGDKR